jgi:hypothetical protein
MSEEIHLLDIKVQLEKLVNAVGGITLQLKRLADLNEAKANEAKK